MRQLHSAGIIALRISGTDMFEEALEGRFWLGMPNIYNNACDKPIILCCALNDSSNVTGTCCDSAMEENFRKCFFFKKNHAVVAIDEVHYISEL